MIDLRGLYRGRTVLVTGGTSGVGLSVALAFAEHGAQVVLTRSGDDAGNAGLKGRFLDTGAPEPVIAPVDVSRSAETEAFLQGVLDRFGRIAAVVFNASGAIDAADMTRYDETTFMEGLRTGAWPAFDYLTAMKRVLGAYPRYVVIMSGDGPDRFSAGGDFTAASMAVTEVLTRYLAYRLRGEGVRINVIRAPALDGPFDTFVRQFIPARSLTTAEDIGRAAFALCSGVFDGLNGQVITIDRGGGFADGINYLYQRRQVLGV